MTQDLAGLDEDEAARRLAVEGPNTLAAQERRRWRAIAADAAREPMFLLLLGAALLYLALGQPGEGLFLCFMVAVSLGLALYQEGRTERALAALRELASPRARVLRGGQWLSVPGAVLVRGDVVSLAEGDRVPADARLASSNGLQTDESLLTGESMPVNKAVGPDPDPAAMVYAGSLVVQGHGIAEVTAAGARSQLRAPAAVTSAMP
jgi:Ca2+-transporting ATPase